MQKTVNIEAKIGLRSNTMVWNLDIYCPKSHCLSNSTAVKVQTKKTTVKELYPKKTKTKDLKPILSCTNMAEPLE